MNKEIGYALLEAPAMDSNSVKVISSNDRRITAEGIVQDLDIQNRNGRIYETKDLLPAVMHSSRTKELLSTGNMWGEDGHPTDKNIGRQSQILPPLCSVMYLSFWNEGNKVKSKFRGTNNERGDAFDLDLRDGIRPSFSLRALGSLENKGGKSYVKNIKFITYDRVIYPSHKSAYTEKILTESTRYEEEFTNKFMIEEDYKGELIPILNSEVIDYIKTESMNLNSIIENFGGFYDSITMMDKNHVQLCTESGEVCIIRLESHIRNELMNYRIKM